MMKAVTAALTKKSSQMSRVVHAEGRFEVMLLKQSFSCKYPGIRWCSRKPVSQDRKNYGKNKDATFGYLQ